MFWVSKRLALVIHDRQLVEHGGRPGLRDGALLESALARPLQLASYRDTKADMASLAASLAFGLVQNMPFVDGNKRVAHVCYRVFLVLNHAEFSASEEDQCLWMFGLASGEISEPEFAAWIRQ